MGGWREAKRLEAGGNGAREEVLQRIFDTWASRGTAVAGAPEWLWALPNPERPLSKGFGYAFTPDAYWAQAQPRIVGELKYGAKFEPVAIAEAVHHAHLLRRIHGGEPIVSVVITQPNYWIRAAIAELDSQKILHVEADLLTLDKQTFLWLSCPHSALGTPSSMPGGLPLGHDWTSLRWSAVQGEPTWIAHDETHKPPFLQGTAVMVSRVRNDRRYEWVLWTGKLPELGTTWSLNDWAEAGSFWLWDVEAQGTRTPPAPR
ncbi:hypothetical protein [Corallococcus sp. CA053C]|uniref:hypothetical protein n=1 Tax=Corallococcus sp. CA053C TaxID=2316732 RepID=UPI0011C38FFA|nr:hypothetical protein [Corallococcus sp. CA053C]